MMISAKLGATHPEKPGASAEVAYPALEDGTQTLAELVNEFGEDAVFNHAKRSFVVALQSFIRTQIEASKSPDEIQAAANEWRPGQKRPGKSPQERIAELMGKLDPTAREAVLKEYGIKPKKAA